MESCPPRNAVVAMYESRARAQVAFNALQDAGLDINQWMTRGRTFSAEEQGLRFAATGIPARTAVTYERDVQAGKFLVLAGGSAHEIGRACALLGTTGPTRLTAHAA
jgi:hypothetical protein